MADKDKEAAAEAAAGEATEGAAAEAPAQPAEAAAEAGEPAGEPTTAADGAEDADGDEPVAAGEAEAQGAVSAATQRALDQGRRLRNVGVGAVAVAVVLVVLAVVGTWRGALEPDAALDTQANYQGVAAEVNGVQIGEDAISAYIEAFREGRGLQDPQAFAEWVEQQGTTVADVRADVLDYYVERELVEQLAAREGVAVSDQQVEEAWQEAIDAAGGQDAYAELMASSGLSLAFSRDMVRQDLLRSALADALAEDATLSDGELLAYIKMSYPEWQGATSLAEVPESVVQEVRDSQAGTLRSKALDETLERFRASSSIELFPLPTKAPYYVEWLEAQQDGDQAPAAEGPDADEQGAL